jgi:hypothetical protein
MVSVLNAVSSRARILRVTRIEIGDGALHVDDTVADALERLAEAMIAVGVHGTVLLPILDGKTVATTSLTVVTPEEQRRGVEGVPGLPHWRLGAHVVNTRAVPYVEGNQVDWDTKH